MYVCSNIYVIYTPLLSRRCSVLHQWNRDQWNFAGLFSTSPQLSWELTSCVAAFHSVNKLRSVSSQASSFFSCSKNTFWIVDWSSWVLHQCNDLCTCTAKPKVVELLFIFDDHLRQRFNYGWGYPSTWLMSSHVFVVILLLYSDDSGKVCKWIENILQCGWGIQSGRDTRRKGIKWPWLQCGNCRFCSRWMLIFHTKALKVLKVQIVFNAT